MPADTRNSQTHDVPTRRQNTLEVVPYGENRIACHDMLGIRRRVRAMEILFISAMVFWIAVIATVIVLCSYLHNARRQPNGQAEKSAPDMRDEGASHE